METVIQEAVQAFQSQKFKSVAACAEYYNIPYSLMRARLKGRSTRSGRPRTVSRISAAEEDGIVSFMTMLDKLDIPGNKYTIQTAANSILQARGDQPVSAKWTTRFLTRHHDKLRVKRDSPKELKRAIAEDPVEIEKWYTDYKGKLDRCGIQPEDLWNADESGFRIGIGCKQHVVVHVDRRNKRISTPKDTERELVTLLECVNAAGDVIPPLVILKSGSRSFMEDWFRQTSLDDDTLVGVSETAYTNDELALEWIKHFHRFSALKQRGEWRMLLLDGHDSHHTFEFLDFCRQKKILVFFLRPHTTHILQPLDVSVFQPYKHWHGVQIALASSLGLSNATKTLFLDRLAEIRRQTFKSNTIRAGWKHTGLFPYNPSIVLGQLRRVTPTQSPPLETAPNPLDTTPDKVEEVDLLYQKLQSDFRETRVTMGKVFKGFKKALTINALQARQIQAMTAAQAHARELHRTRQRISGISGEPSVVYTTNARKAVNLRDQFIKKRDERKQTLKNARDARRVADQAVTDQVQLPPYHSIEWVMEDMGQ
jgi:hypothetical protein